MARRRLNVGFLATLGTGVAVAAAGAGALWHFHGKQKDPAQLIAIADDAFSKHDYLTAAGNYLAAADQLPSRADLHVKAGECCYQLAITGNGGVARYRQAVGEFNTAASLDPTNTEAYAGLLKSDEYAVSLSEGHNLTDLERTNMAGTLGQMQDAANHMVKIDPNNAQAQATRLIMTIRIWRSNMAMPELPEERGLPPQKRKTADQRGEAAIDDLAKMMVDHPENDQIPLWIANGKIYQGKQVLRLARKGNASAYFAEASTAFDPAIAAKPDLVALYMGKAAILQQLFQIDSTPGTDYIKRLHETVEIAQSKADYTKSPQEYQQAKFAWSRVLRTSDVTGSEDVLRDLTKKFPNEIGLRVLLAKDLHGDRGRDVEALAVLDDIQTLAGPPVTELDLRNRWDWQVASSKLARADIELDELEMTPSGDNREKLVKDISDSIDSGQKRFAGTSLLLTLQGRLQMLQGKKREAVDTLTDAVDKMKVEGGGTDYRLLRIEAMAYNQAGQTNKAISILESQMKDPVSANNPEVHLALADMCLQQQDFARAKIYIDWLAARMPKDVRVIRMQIDDMGPTPSFDAIETLYKMLPETAPTEMAVKCNYALRVRNYDEAVRLLSGINKINPAEPTIAMQLASLLTEQKRNPEALDVLNASLKLNPDNGALKIAISRAGGATNDELAAESLEQIKLMKDPFEQEKAYFRFYQAQNKADEAAKHLMAAQKLRPDDRATLSTLFVFYIQTHRFPEAQEMLPRMVEMNIDDAHGMIFEIKLALAMSEPQKAVALGQKFTHDAPNFAGSWEMYGEALQANHQPALACEQYRQALLLQATNTEALNRLIECNVMQGKIVEARADIADACKRFPSDATYRTVRQKFEIEFGDSKSVLSELDQQIQDHPSETVAYAVEVDALQACIHGKAAEGDAATAAEYQQKQIALYKEAIKRWPEDFRFTNGLAQVYAQSNKLPEAEKILLAIAQTKAWKDKPRPMIVLGQLYLAAGNLDLAEQNLKHALELKSDSTDALLSLSDVKQKKGDSEAALAVLQPFVADFTIRARYTGLLMQNPERWPQAELEVSDALKADPTDNQLTNLMLYVYYGEHKSEQGLALADAAINSPRGGDAFDYLWRAKLHLVGTTADRDAATKDLNHFLDAVPTSGEGHLLMAEIDDGKGDRDAAISELNTAVKLNPQDRMIRTNLVNEYLASKPQRISDAETLLTSTLAMPSFSSDPEFEARLSLIQAQKKDKDSQDKSVTLMQKAMVDAGANKKALLRDYFNVLLLTKNNELLLTESANYITDATCPYFIYADRGVAKAAIGDTAGATTEFNTALDRAGTEPGRIAAMSVTQSITGADKFSLAKTIDLVTPRTKDNPLWQLIVAEMLVNNHDLPTATRQVEAAMASSDKLNPGDRYHLFELAASIYLTSNPPVTDKALPLYTKILEIAPNNIDAMNNLACIYVDMCTPSQPDKALKYSQQAYDICTKGGVVSPRTADTHGWVLIQNGRLSDGVGVLHGAIGKADFPEIHYHLAMGYIKMGKPSAARIELDTATQMVQKKHDEHQEVDETLPAKIAAAAKLADQADGARSDGKSAS